MRAPGLQLLADTRSSRGPACDVRDARMPATKPRRCGGNKRMETSSSERVAARKFPARESRTQRGCEEHPPNVYQQTTGGGAGN